MPTQAVTQSIQHWDLTLQDCRIFIQKLATKGGEPEAAGQPLPIHFPAQHAHTDQPTEIVFESLAVAEPALLAAVAAGFAPEVAGIQALLLKIPVEGFREGQASNGPASPVTAASIQQVGGVSDGEASRPWQPTEGCPAVCSRALACLCFAGASPLAGASGSAASGARQRCG